MAGGRELGVDAVYDGQCRFLALRATIDDLGLGVELPGGGRREEPPLPREIDDLSTPAVYAAGSSVGVCLSLLADRRAATRMALDIYADALRERLRYELALSYRSSTTSMR